MKRHMKELLVVLTMLLSVCSIAVAAPKKSKSTPKKKQTAATTPAKKTTSTNVQASQKVEAPKTKLLSEENLVLLKTGTPEEIIAAINSGTMSLTDKTKFDESVLMYAANENPHPKVIPALVNAGADVNYKDKNGNSTLSIVIHHREADFVNELIAAGAIIDDEVSSSALCNPDIEIVKKFLKPELLKDDSISNPFFRAVRSNTNPEAIKLLIASGADVNFKDPLRGFTPIIYAIDSKKASIETFDLLLENGADINAHMLDGVTALHKTVNSGNLEKLTYLLEKGAEVNTRDKAGQTPLMYAVKTKNNASELIKILIAHGADVNTFDKNGNTAALLAAENTDNPEVISILLEANANFTVAKKIKGPFGSDIMGDPAAKIALNIESIKDTQLFWKLNDIYWNFCNKM